MLSARFVSNCRNIFPFLVKPFTSMPAETNILSLQRNLWMSSLLSRFFKIIFRFSYLSVPIAPPSSSLLTGVPGRVLKANAASPLFILKTCRTNDAEFKLSKCQRHGLKIPIGTKAKCRHCFFKKIMYWTHDLLNFPQNNNDDMLQGFLIFYQSRALNQFLWF